MHPYSSDTAKPQAERTVPTTQSDNASPILPTDLTMAPGVAKIPDPITRDITRMYALDHEMFRPYVAVSGIVSCSTERSGASGEMVSDEAIDDGESRGVCSDDSMSDIFVRR